MRRRNRRWAGPGPSIVLPDGLTDTAPMRGRIDDWRAFLDAGLDEEDRDAIRKAERTGRLRLKRRPGKGDCH